VKTGAGSYAFANAGCWAGVAVTEEDLLDVRFGPLRIRTPLDNVAAADVTGPYVAWRVLGVRLSLADGGLTLGTATERGARIRFRDPVGPLRHRALTVTVEAPHLLVRRLRRHLALREVEREPARR
jgi:hypothetical protein